MPANGARSRKTSRRKSSAGRPYERLCPRTARPAQELRQERDHPRRPAGRAARRARRHHRAQRRRQEHAVQPDQLPLCAHLGRDPSARPAHRRQEALRDQPPRPGSQLPGLQPVHAAVGVREHPLCAAVEPGPPLCLLEVPGRPGRCQRPHRADPRNDQARQAPRRAGDEPHLCRGACAGNRHHDRRRCQPDPARRAHRRHEQERNQTLHPADPRRDRRQDPADRGA
mmetsp:Transcript_54949/g.134444  ORF Transcript_54949/g.134444 Transcript_54949/m.134444 type:complete len:227 (+) Transcript_54949:149-829(+)